MASFNSELKETMNIHPILPEDWQLTYLDEGAANVVYQVDVRPPTPLPSSLEEYGDGTPPPTEVEFDEKSSTHIFQNKLLRLRKALPTTAPCRVAQHSFERFIKPLFQAHEIVDQTLVHLSPVTLERLNSELKEWEQSGHILGSTTERIPKRRGTYLANDEYGLLVTDMTPELPGQYFVEFKAKWLLQSPSAPSNAKRCRTCALAARTKAQGKKGEPLKSPVCPLDLTSSDPQVLKAVAGLINDLDPINTERFTKWLQNTRLLHRLRQIQSTLDPKGVLEADIDDPNLLVAMTLRDCTVFVRFPENPEHDDWAVEARLGDLDLKSKGKEQYWKSLELSLIEEGWYEGLEPKEQTQALTCALSRQ